MSKVHLLLGVVVTLFIYSLAGCQSKQPVKLKDGTAEMVTRLEKLSENVNPRTNEYANLKRVEYYRSLPEPERPDRNIQYHARIAQELLYSGQTEEAIDKFKTIREALENRDLNAPQSFVTTIEELLAISYMRLGEQQNCLLNHSSSSCLIPIEGEGVHSLTEGSEKAIEAYTEILEKRPNDMASQWLLNVAYMTLGKYPDEVPNEWLIPKDVFDSDYEIGRFYDIAPDLGLAEMGLSGGSITEDFNNDGHIDIMASSWGLEDQLQYYQNNGDGTFTKKTKEAGLTGITGGLNMIHADFDNDGYADVFVLRGAWLANDGKHPNSLLHNNGDGTFSDVTENAGLLSRHPTQTAAWGDYNNDGWLDLYIGNEKTRNSYNPSELYRNNGDGTFTNVAVEVGINATGFIKGVVWGDYNNDGLQDLYVSRLGESNLLYHNDGAKGNSWSFTEVAEKAGVQEPIRSFPTWFWDYNNDGWLDIFVSGYYANAADVANEYLGKPTQATMPRLYENNHDGTFEDVTQKVKLNKVLYSMGSNYGDLDNDGYSDFYVGTGDPDFRALMPSRMFRNNAGKNFQEVTTSGGFGNIQKGHGVSFADLDHDGDQDIFMVMGGALKGDTYLNLLFENPGHDNHWLTLDLEGEASNRSAIGARIKISVEGSEGTEYEIHKTVSTGGSFGSNSLQQEIGLGDAESVRSVSITWPTTGKTQTFTDLAMDSHYKVKEGEKPINISRPTFSLRAN
ncbi:CRTAC1 family protein [Balneolaceae bacterium YR4-1]|uniref:CRTAC1 family protein n=1 Tax=Halalkalibaculum roseum TaxID=2709311 RepID=A0A6M1SVN1_9BACT|nr:CRTAC1 family protein [Halalkalibaculum roseum]NGP77020.1 CRTAC1 family protein [Halalkalibaculum roseum]